MTDRFEILERHELTKSPCLSSSGIWSWAALYVHPVAGCAEICSRSGVEPPTSGLYPAHDHCLASTHLTLQSLEEKSDRVDFKLFEILQKWVNVKRFLVNWIAQLLSTQYVRWVPLWMSRLIVSLPSKNNKVWVVLILSNMHLYEFWIFFSPPMHTNKL